MIGQTQLLSETSLVQHMSVPHICCHIEFMSSMCEVVVCCALCALWCTVHMLTVLSNAWEHCTSLASLVYGAAASKLYVQFVMQ